LGRSPPVFPLVAGFTFMQSDESACALSEPGQADLSP
jgi:hypothetical protein